MKKQLLSEGIKAILKFCHEYRSEKTFRQYQSACAKVQSFYSEKNMEYYYHSFNEELKKYAEHLITSSSPKAYGSARFFFRTLCMIDDYFSGESFKHGYHIKVRYKNKLDPFYEECAQEVKASLSQKKLTIPVIYSIIRDFFYFLQLNAVKDFNLVHQDTIYSFMRYEYPTHTGCMNNVIYATKLICKHLRQKGYENLPEEVLPFALPPSQKKILPAFNYNDLQIILNSPDTSQANGKRDYAILILASVTGMRAIDIANLELTDINWINKTIAFIQHKTGYGQALPLNESAALAIADYILNGRPRSNSSYIFLTKNPPYRKLNDKSSVANVLNRYIQASGVKKSANDGKSFHAFRRSMGAWLLSSGVNPEMISQILGHHSHDVLKKYLPIEVTALKICALDLTQIPVKSEVYK